MWQTRTNTPSFGVGSGAQLMYDAKLSSLCCFACFMPWSLLQLGMILSLLVCNFNNTSNNSNGLCLFVVTVVTRIGVETLWLQGARFSELCLFLASVPNDLTVKTQVTRLTVSARG